MKIRWATHNHVQSQKKKVIEMSEEFDFPLLPLRDVVVFPNMVVPLFVGRDKSIKALEYAMSKDKEVFLSAQRDAKVDNPGVKDIFLFGTLGTVLQLLRLPDGTVKALIEGKQGRRSRISSPTRTFSWCGSERLRKIDRTPSPLPWPEPFPTASTSTPR
jgi:ATP-dependent Lon protease